MKKMLLSGTALMAMMSTVAHAQTFDTAAPGAVTVGFAKPGAHTHVQDDCQTTMPADAIELVYHHDDGRGSALKSVGHNEVFMEVNMTKVGKVVFSYKTDVEQTNGDGEIVWQGEPEYSRSWISARHAGRVTGLSDPWPGPSFFEQNDRNGTTYAKFPSLHTGHHRLGIHDVFLGMPSDFVLDEHYDASIEVTLTCYTN